MKKILLLLAQGFEEFEASVFTDVFGWSREHGTEGVDVVTGALESELKCTWNFTVIPQILIKNVDVDEYDGLAVPGGFERAGFYEDAFHDNYIQIIKSFHKRGKIIASICTGALPLGKSGILKGKKATTYHLMDGYRQNQLKEFGGLIDNKHIVVDDNIITSSSPATALDVAFLFLQLLTSIENVSMVKYHMGFTDTALFFNTL